MDDVGDGYVSKFNGGTLDIWLEGRRCLGLSLSSTFGHALGWASRSPRTTWDGWHVIKQLSQNFDGGSFRTLDTWSEEGRAVFNDGRRIYVHFIEQLSRDFDGGSFGTLDGYTSTLSSN